jgi:light-regulated signal transduction histidine kinase (bacteriophytochrome)
MLPPALLQLAIGGQRRILGSMILLFVAMALLVARRQTASIERQIRLALEHEALAHELRHERDRTNQANLELQVQIEQQRHSTEHIKDLNRDLELQALELRQANSDLESFSYSVSHDLRTPLRAIHGFATQLTQRLAPQVDEQSRHFLARITENVSRMSMLIDDLLEFSKCGRHPLAVGDLDMNVLARTAAAEAVSAHELQRAPEIVIESLPSARGDPRLILQVWRNLLDNAVKYSSKIAAPCIVVRGHQEAGRFIFEVSDNGIGFDSRYSEALFGVFRRLHRTSDYPGSGVGLAIVHRIVARHEGTVWARSQPNRGATFGFSLPQMAPQAQGEADDPSDASSEPRPFP